LATPSLVGKLNEVAGTIVVVWPLKTEKILYETADPGGPTARAVTLRLAGHLRFVVGSVGSAGDIDTVRSVAAGDGCTDIPMLAEIVKAMRVRRGTSDIRLRSFA